MSETTIEVPSLYISMITLTCKVCKSEVSVSIPETATPLGRVRIINETIKDGCFDCEDELLQRLSVQAYNGARETLEGNIE